MTLRSDSAAIVRTGRRAGAGLPAFGLQAGLPAFGLQAGFTMIERRVARTILVGMILAFATILTQSQRVVSGAQRNMKANSAAAAIAQTFRRDIRQATRHGLRCIMQHTDISTPQLVATTAGLAPSRTNPLIGSGGVVHFGLCGNQAPNPPPNPPLPPVLYYQRWVLREGATPSGDIWPFDLAFLQSFTRSYIGLFVEDCSGCTPGASTRLGGAPISIPPVSVPPVTIGDVNALWQVLADKCEWMSITWTDGSKPTGGNLNWDGVEYVAGAGYAPTGKDPAWRDKAFDPNDPTQIEFAVSKGAGRGYRALWTKENQNNWPKLIKIRFELTPAPGDDKGNEYEVICPVGR